jgi:hypothetical protein
MSLLRAARKRPLALAITAVLLTGAVVIASSKKHSGEAALSSAPLARDGPFAETAWPKGTRTSYHVTWRTNAGAVFESPAKGKEQKKGLETAFDLEGDLQIDAYGPRADGIALGLRWVKIDRVKAEALGKPIATREDLEAQLRGAEMVMIIEPGGRIRELGFGAATTPLARHVDRALALDLTAEIAAANGSVDVVDTAIGRARITRKANGPRDSHTTNRTAYDELDAFPNGFATDGTRVDARGEVTSTPNGLIDRVASDEVLEAAGDETVSAFHSSTSLVAKLLGRTTEAIALPTYTPASVRPKLDDAGYDREASLRRRSLGVTRESVRADVRAAALFPKMVTTEWIWRDSAYLELHPEEAEHVIADALPVGLASVAAAFDVIVIAGADEGQAALVRALQGPAAESEEGFVTLIQRTGYVWRPTPELVAFVGRERGRFRGTDRGHAATYTLGSLVHAVAREQPEVAMRIARELVDELQSPKTTPDERLAILHALGNAGLDPTATAVAAFARDGDREVRRTVAHALRKIDTDAVIETLRRLAVDSDPDVAGVALDSLLRKQLDAEDWEWLAQQVTSGALQSETHASLVNGLNRRRGEDPGAAIALAAMAESPLVAPDVKQRIEAMLHD